MTAATTEARRPPPRPVIRMFWLLHHAAYRLTRGGFGLSRPVAGGTFGMMRLTTVDRSSVPVTVQSLPDRRLPAAVEATAYFVVSEGLANVAKHASATNVSIAASTTPTTFRIEVGDDGVGGADATHGSGIRGLQDRVAAIGGTLTAASPSGQGTLLVAEIPIS